LPEKPSVTTTSILPRDSWSPSVKPSNEAAGNRHPEAGRGLLELAGSLELFGADVEQPHSRSFDPQHGSCIGRAHDRELNQVLGIALGVGAKVEHDHVGLAERREKRGERGAVDSRHRPQRELDIAIIAPVLPADTAASARPSFTAPIAIPIDVVRARRIAWLGFSLARSLRACGRSRPLPRFADFGRPRAGSAARRHRR
jgi:hypothetical protein